MNTRDTFSLSCFISACAAEGGAALGQGTVLQGDADIDVSICLRGCLGDTQRAATL